MSLPLAPRLLYPVSSLTPPQFDFRPLEEIETNIRTIGKDIIRILGEMTGGNGAAK